MISPLVAEIEYLEDFGENKKGDREKVAMNAQIRMLVKNKTAKIIKPQERNNK